jgi:ribosomal protein S18 acetylase RimI-like enzyme
MILVTDISCVTNAYNYTKNFKKEFVTNCFLSIAEFQKLITKSLIFEIKKGEVVFFLKKNNNFFNLYYFASCVDELENELPCLYENFTNKILVVDIVSKSELCKEKNIFEKNNFKLYTELFRMSSTLNYYNQNIVNLEQVRNATPEDAILVNDLLENYFDPKSEQLPDLDDIFSWISNNSIILFVEKNKIVGFIIYDLKPATLFLRYWFVHPDYRNLKIGSKLFKEFLFRGRHTKRQLLWVINKNENAIKRYNHYGFKEEKLFNYVLIKNKFTNEN